jgi:hypothetical protein
MASLPPPVSNDLPGNPAGKTVYTVKLDNGSEVDIEGPTNATPEQLNSFIAQQLQGQPGNAPLVDPAMETVQGFSNEIPTDPASHLAPEDHAAYLELARNPATTPRQLEDFFAQHGFVLHNAKGIIEDRDRGLGVSKGVVVRPPEVHPAGGAAAAAARGVGDVPSFGFLDELGAVADSLGGTEGRENVLNSDKSFGDLYDRNLDINRAMLHADEENHPIARLTGQLIGGMAIPVGLEGVGLQAGKSVLRLGGTMREARAAAAVAVRNRMAAMGGAYGAAHGAGTAEGGLGDRALGAATEGAEGAAGSYLLTGAGQMAPRLAEKLGMGANKPDYAAMASDLGIERTPATNSRFGMSTAVQAGMDTLPGGNSAVEAGRSAETQGLADAARDVAASTGTVTSREGAGQAVATGAAAYRRATKTAGGKLYRERDALMGGESAPVAMDQTQRTILDLNNQFPNSPAIAQLNEHPVIRRIWQALPGNNTNELTLGEATEALSHVRSVVRTLEAKRDTPTTIISRVARTEQAIEDDVMAAARKADEAAGGRTGPGSAVQAQIDADRYWADRSRALRGALKTPIASADDNVKVSGESVYNQIYGDMNRKGGNLARLRDTWFRIPTNARRTFTATAIDDLGRATSGQQNDLGTNWSFNTFLTNLDKLSPQARNIVFGTEANTKVSQIAAYASRLKQIDRARNFSNTAKNVFAAVYLTTVGGALWHGNLIGAAEDAAALPATWAGAKLFLATPKMRDWTLQAMKALTGANAGKPSDAAFRALTARLKSIAAADPAIAGEALGLQQRILNAVNDNVASAAASGGNQQQNAKGK